MRAGKCDLIELVELDPMVSGWTCCFVGFPVKEEVFLDALVGDAAGFNSMWFLTGSVELKLLQAGDFVLPGKAGGIVGDAVQEDGVLGEDEGAVDFDFLNGWALDAG